MFRGAVSREISARARGKPLTRPPCRHARRILRAPQHPKPAPSGPRTSSHKHPSTNRGACGPRQALVGADVSRSRIPRNIRPRPSQTPHTATLSAPPSGHCPFKSAQPLPLPDQARVHKHPSTNRGACGPRQTLVGADVSRSRIPRNIRPRPSERSLGLRRATGVPRQMAIPTWPTGTSNQAAASRDRRTIPAASGSAARTGPCFPDLPVPGRPCRTA